MSLDLYTAVATGRLTPEQAADLLMLRRAARRKRRHWVLRALSFLALVLTGCATVPPPAGSLPAGGLDRFYKVADHLYRSAQPTAAQFKILATTYNIRTVIKLNSAIDHDALPDGVDIAQDPWYPAGPVEHGEIAAVLDDIDACVSGDGDCLVHCTEGRDRTGLAIALWRVRHGATPDAAFGEWVHFGSHRFKGFEEAFEREVRLMGYKDWSIPK